MRFTIMGLGHIQTIHLRRGTWTRQSADTSSISALPTKIHKDNHLRAIAAQLLANLAAYSDPEKRIMNDFEALLNCTRDERFVTARHTLQSIWKTGIAGQEQRQLVVEGLARRFADCAAEKNCTLIRYDIAQGLRNLYNVTQGEAIREHALGLIETEPDLKYRKKYAAVWK
jgi:hypothetical protein